MNKKNIISLIVISAVFTLFTICLLFVDKSFHLLTGKEIGLTFLNKYSFDLNYNETLDKLSDIFLILSIISILTVALLGFIQLIKRKSLYKVDQTILSFGVVLVIMVILWVVFDKLAIINYRPILIEGKLEPSYISTHIMVVTFALLGSSTLFTNYINKNKINIVVFCISILSTIATFILRFLSGMHWISDCLGGLLLGLILYFIFLNLKSLKLKSLNSR